MPLMVRFQRKSWKREVTDWGAALAKLSPELDASALNGAAAYRLGDLERALAKSKGFKAKEAKELLNSILGPLIKVKENAPSLKRTGPKVQLKPLLA